MKDFKEETVDNKKILKIVKEINLLIEDDEYKNFSFRDFKKDYPDKINGLEEALFLYMVENDLKILKTGFPDRWK